MDRYQLSVVGNEHVLRGIEVACVAGLNVMLQSSDHRGYAEDLVWGCEQIVAECEIDLKVKHFGYCPCGYLKSPTSECHCSFEQINRYQIIARRAIPRYPVWLQGCQPLADEVFREPFRDLETPEKIAERVGQARRKGYVPIRRVQDLDRDSFHIMRTAFDQFDFGVRGVTVALQLANAICLLDHFGKTVIDVCHVAEAIQYVRRPWVSMSQVR